jgi:glucose-1-phosphate thymidylyltransferase
VREAGSSGSIEDLIGVLPAAGRAQRLAPLPCSKELYPIGFRSIDADGSLRPKVVCHYALEKMRLAGVTKVFIVVREGKWDIPAYFRDGSMLDMHIAYLLMGLPFGAPYTLDQAYPFTRDKRVVFAFPDIVFQPDDAFTQLLRRQADSAADIALGLFPAEQPQKVDMVDFHESGRVRAICPRPYQTHLRYTWGIAVWTPIFTEFLHEYVADHKASVSTQPELSVGAVIQAAIQEGLRVQAAPVSDVPYLDIGTPEDLARAVRRFAVQQEDIR